MIQRLVAALAAVLLGASASAQICLGPDGLSGPNCWAPVPANLPQFDGFTLPGLNVCWIDCDPVSDCANVDVKTPAMIACGYYVADLAVLDCSGLPLLGGRLQLDYTRTWDEVTVDPVPRRLQVYRFVAKVDIEALQAGPITCKVPTCATTNTAFYYGYVDWAIDCDTGAVENSIVLFHACDYFIHGALSSVPGSFHPNESYAVVAPSTMLNPFVPANIPPPSFAFMSEATRLTSHVPGSACITEDPISQGNVQLLAQGCACPFAPMPAQLSARRLTGTGTCTAPDGTVTSFLSADLTPGFPWIHMMTHSIGYWSTPASYPGEEAVWVDEVPLRYRDSCTVAAGIKKSWAEIYYGASTSQGYDVVTTGLSREFTDLAANRSWRIGSTKPSTWMGNALATRNLIYFNP